MTVIIETEPLEFLERLRQRRCEGEETLGKTNRDQPDVFLL